MALDEPNDADATFDHEGFTLVAERQLIDELGGVAIDFVRNAHGEGFDLRILGGEAGGCGDGSCGSSCH